MPEDNERPVSSRQPQPYVSKFKEFGVTGLKRNFGYVDEEFLTALQGRKAVKVYREMADNDPTVGAALRAIDQLVRQTKWTVEPASDNERDLAIAEFVEQCMGDMYHTWDDFVSEAMSMLQYGWSVHEIAYRRRRGPSANAEMSSRYKDNRIGWKGFPIRSQDSIEQWLFDERGEIRGLIQNAPPHYEYIEIPAHKLLLFRTGSHKNNPEGRSILRNAYRPWYYKRRIEEIEAIGIERDLAGFPVMYVDPQIMDATSTDEQRAMLDEYKALIRNIRRDSSEGVILPAVYDELTKNPIYRLELMNSGGARAFDINQVVTRYDHQIARTMLADFILLGQQTHGSYALSNDKSSLFVLSVRVWLEIVKEQINNYAVPELLWINGIEYDRAPLITYGSVENRSLTEVASFIQQLAGAGAALFPNDELTKTLMEEANLPYAPPDPEQAGADDPIMAAIQQLYAGQEQANQQPIQPAQPQLPMQPHAGQ